MATYGGNVLDPGPGKRFNGGGWLNRLWGGNVFPPVGPVGPGLIYRMRGYDTTLTETVFWASDHVDAAADDYGGPGPVVDVVVQKKIGT